MTNTVPKEVCAGILPGPKIRKVACMSNVFSSSLGDGARVTFVVGVVAADSVAASGGDDAGDGDWARVMLAWPHKLGSAINATMMNRRAFTLKASPVPIRKSNRRPSARSKSRRA